MVSVIMPQWQSQARNSPISDGTVSDESHIADGHVPWLLFMVRDLVRVLVIQ